MFVCFVNYSSVINLIYSRNLFYYNNTLFWSFFSMELCYFRVFVAVKDTPSGSETETESSTGIGVNRIKK